MAAFTSINDPSVYFNTVLYTGTGSSQSITGVGFAPDLVWAKQRNGTNAHMVADTVRGADNKINPNQNYANDTNAVSLTAFGADGFTGGGNTEMNGSSLTYAAWNWIAGTTSGITGGGITPNGYSINTTTGIGIFEYTGSSSTSNIAHGLGVVPQMIIIKSLTTTNDWTCYHEAMGNDKFLTLNTSGQETTDATTWDSTSPTSTLWYMGDSGDVNNSARDYMAYVFANVKGYSRFGEYIGNADVDGPTIYTGFRPAWVMIKGYDASALSWYLWDSKRLGYNPDNNVLYPNGANAESTTDQIHLLSNGFKFITTDSEINGSGTKYIYAAFAEAPFVNSSGVPVNAR